MHTSDNSRDSDELFEFWDYMTDSVRLTDSAGIESLDSEIQNQPEFDRIHFEFLKIHPILWLCLAYTMLDEMIVCSRCDDGKAKHIPSIFDDACLI